MPLKDPVARAAYKAAWEKRNHERLLVHKRAYNARNQERKTLAARKSHLATSYNLSLEMWDTLFDAQGSRCAVCRTEDGGRYWHTDHDHDTGKVRGILCHNCNVGLGHFKDSDSLLMAAATYIRERRSKG